MTKFFNSFGDKDGFLIPIEFKEIPFEVQRIFCVKDVIKNTIRGEHSHFHTKQFLICLQGQIEIYTNDGKHQSTTNLTANQGIYLPEMVWGHQKFLTGQDPVVTSSASWTVIASSNGIVANTSDNWNGLSDITSADAGVAHSWIVLQSPTGMLPNSGSMQFLIDCSASAAVATELVRPVWTHSGSPFTGSFISTLNPPGVPTQGIDSTGTTATGNRQILENTPSLLPHTLHMQRTTRGDFFIGFIQNGSGKINSTWSCLRLTGGDGEILNNDPYPVVAGCVRNTAASYGPLTPNAPFVGDDGSATSGMAAWWIDGTPVLVSSGLTLSYPAKLGNGAALSKIDSSNSFLFLTLVKDEINISGNFISVILIKASSSVCILPN
jgi:hypothetical protein